MHERAGSVRVDPRQDAEGPEEGADQLEGQPHDAAQQRAERPPPRHRPGRRGQVGVPPEQGAPLLQRGEEQVRQRARPEQRDPLGAPAQPLFPAKVPKIADHLPRVATAHLFRVRTHQRPVDPLGCPKTPIIRGAGVHLKPPRGTKRPAAAGSSPSPAPSSPLPQAFRAPPLAPARQSP